MAGRAGNLEHVSNALHAEALAMLYAISTITQMGCNHVIFETDSGGIEAGDLNRGV